MIFPDKKKAIRFGFEEVVKEFTKPGSEQREFLLRHQIYPVWELNMEKQIRLAELNPRFHMDAKKYQALIKAGAQIAVQCWINAKMKELMTPAELARHQSKADEMKNTQELLDEMAKEAMSTTIKKGFTGGRQKDSGTGNPS